MNTLACFLSGIARWPYHSFTFQVYCWVSCSCYFLCVLCAKNSFLEQAIYHSHWSERTISKSDTVFPFAWQILSEHVQHGYGFNMKWFLQDHIWGLGCQFVEVFWEAVEYVEGGAYGQNQASRGWLALKVTSTARGQADLCPTMGAAAVTRS